MQPVISVNNTLFLAENRAAVGQVLNLDLGVSPGVALSPPWFFAYQDHKFEEKLGPPKVVAFSIFIS